MKDCIKPKSKGKRSFIKPEIFDNWLNTSQEYSIKPQSHKSKLKYKSSLVNPETFNNWLNTSRKQKLEIQKQEIKPQPQKLRLQELDTLINKLSIAIFKKTNFFDQSSQNHTYILLNLYAKLQEMLYSPTFYKLHDVIKAQKLANQILSAQTFDENVSTLLSVSSPLPSPLSASQDVILVSFDGYCFDARDTFSPKSAGKFAFEINDLLTTAVGCSAPEVNDVSLDQ